MDDVRDVFLNVGEELRLSFNEACSGGYLWSWSTSSNAVTVTAGARKPFGGGIGDLCRRDFTIVADAPGDYDVKFVHKRPRERNADKTLHFLLHVKL